MRKSEKCHRVKSSLGKFQYYSYIQLFSSKPSPKINIPVLYGRQRFKNIGCGLIVSNVDVNEKKNIKATEVLDWIYIDTL